MSMAFGRQAVRLAALAAQMLAWRPDDFWRATPAELAASLAPLSDTQVSPLARADFERMMETENG